MLAIWGVAGVVLIIVLIATAEARRRTDARGGPARDGDAGFSGGADTGAVGCEDGSGADGGDGGGDGGGGD